MSFKTRYTLVATFALLPFAMAFAKQPVSIARASSLKPQHLSNFMPNPDRYPQYYAARMASTSWFPSEIDTNVLAGVIGNGAAFRFRWEQPELATKFRITIGNSRGGNDRLDSGIMVETETEYTPSANEPRYIANAAWVPCSGFLTGEEVWVRLSTFSKATGTWLHRDYPVVVDMYIFDQ